jgi:hypothetical protein
MAKSTQLIAIIAVHSLLGCEPSEPDPVPVEGGIQHPVREAGAPPPADAGMSGGGDSGGGRDSGAADADDSETGDK